MTTPDPHPNTTNDLVPHLVPDLVPDRPRAHCETTSSPVPSSSIGDEVTEPSAPRPTTSSQTQDDHPHNQPVTTVSNPMDSGQQVEPHGSDLTDLIEGIRSTWGPFARDAEQVIDTLLGQRAEIASNRNALALKLADLRAEHVRLRAGVAALVDMAEDLLDHSSVIGADFPNLVDELRALVPQASAPGELHDQPHQQHERSEAPQPDGQDDEQLSALGVADQGMHGRSVGAAPAAGLGFDEIRDVTGQMTLSEEWFDLVADLPVSEEVEDLGLRVRDIVTISRWLEPAVERILAARLDETQVEARELRERGDRWQHAWLDQTANLATAQPSQSGCWVARYGDWSGIAVFGSELEALRYTNDHDGMVASFVQWGEVR